jgi:hypothetical protein
MRFILLAASMFWGLSVSNISMAQPGEQFRGGANNPNNPSDSIGSPVLIGPGSGGPGHGGPGHGGPGGGGPGHGGPGGGGPGHGGPGGGGPGHGGPGGGGPGHGGPGGGGPGHGGPGGGGPGHGGPGHGGPGHGGPGGGWGGNPPLQDLCQGNYAGQYSNGAQGNFTFYRSGRTGLAVVINLYGFVYQGSGRCVQNGEFAQFEYYLNGPNMNNVYSSGQIRQSGFQVYGGGQQQGGLQFNIYR